VRNQIKTILLLGVLSALLVALGAAISPAAFWLMAVVALAMNLGAYFFSDRIVLRMHGAREVTPGELPRLRAMVDELSARAGIPAPRLFVMEEDQPNAFATGRSPRRGVVALTRGILHLLDERELRGVVAHELAHIRNRDILLSTIAAAAAAAVGGVANALQLSTLFGGSEEEGGSSGVGALAMAFVAPIAALFVQLGISRAREYLADETGPRLSGDPEALACALEKLALGAEASPLAVAPATSSLFIVNPLAGEGRGQRLAAWLSTHPPIEERVRRLRTLAWGAAVGVPRVHPGHRRTEARRAGAWS
jgi:heat shock protein HtpX